MSDERAYRELVANVAMAEFARLRDEIDRRSDSQDRLLNLAVTGAGVIGTVIFAARSGGVGAASGTIDQLVVVLPIFAMALGLLWLDHDRAIRRIGADINLRLRPIITNATREPELLANEKLAFARRRRYLERTLLVATPYAAVFLIIPLIGVVASYRHVDGLLELFYWFQFVIFLAYYLPLWLGWWFVPDDRRRRIAESIHRWTTRNRSRRRRSPKR